jgi:hypothetical protein
MRMGRLTNTLPISPEILQVVMHQLQNFVQPCPEWYLARGALSLEEEWEGGKRCGVSAGVRKE